MGGLYANEPGEAGSGEQPRDRETLQCLEGLIHRGEGTGGRWGVESWDFTVTFTSPTVVVGFFMFNMTR